MNKKNLLLSLLLPLLIDSTHASEKCINIKYIKFTSLYYVAVNKNQLLERPDRAFEIESKDLYALYEKYNQSLPEHKKTEENGDFRVAFKPCTQNEWSFVSMSESISIKNNQYILTSDEFKMIVMAVDPDIK